MPVASHAQIVSAVLEIAKTKNGKIGQVTRVEIKQKLALEVPPLTLPNGQPDENGKKTPTELEAVGAAKEDATKAQAIEAASKIDYSLDSPLIKLFVPKSSATPMYRWNMKLKDKIEQATPNSNPLVQEQMLTRLMTVLCQTEVQQLLDTSLANGITVKAFCKMTANEQLAVVNSLWDECTTTKAYDTLQSAMVDNTNVVDKGGGQLPSSIHPNGGGGLVTEFKTGRAGQAFQQLGVGFRVEGSHTGKGIGWHLGRVMRDGMWPQVTIETLMQLMGKNVAGTKVSGKNQAPRVNVTQKDLWNESGICVARSFFGATAFPLREFKGNVIMWALDVSGLTGLDTEKYQLDEPAGGNGPWRAGEKCFGRIEPERVLGSLVFNKMGDEGGGWRFEIDANAEWTLRAPGKAGQRDYIQAELAAWKGHKVHVGTSFDFVQRG